jgi:hypothetical protein
MNWESLPKLKDRGFVKFSEENQHIRFESEAGSKLLKWAGLV